MDLAQDNETDIWSGLLLLLEKERMFGSPVLKRKLKYKQLKIMHAQ